MIFLPVLRQMLENYEGSGFTIKGNQIDAEDGG